MKGVSQSFRQAGDAAQINAHNLDALEERYPSHFSNICLQARRLSDRVESLYRLVDAKHQDLLEQHGKPAYDEGSYHDQA